MKKLVCCVIGLKQPQDRDTHNIICCFHGIPVNAEHNFFLL